MDEDIKRFIENTAAETRRHFDVVAERLITNIDTVAEGVVGANERIDRLSADMANQFNHVNGRIDRFSSDTANQFNHVNGRIDRLSADMANQFNDVNGRIDRLASDMANQFGEVDGKIDSLSADLAIQFNDVRSMIKFSHHELDRRLHALEDVVSNLQARIERLETSTH